jgi:hypothetical protein
VGYGSVNEIDRYDNSYIPSCISGAAAGSVCTKENIFIQSLKHRAVRRLICNSPCSSDYGAIMKYIIAELKLKLIRILREYGFCNIGEMLPGSGSNNNRKCPDTRLTSP